MKFIPLIAATLVALAGCIHPGQTRCSSNTNSNGGLHRQRSPGMGGYSERSPTVAALPTLQTRPPRASNSSLVKVI